MFPITDYGAVSGGEFLCTDAIQNAVDACAAAGGGTVLVPAGLYLTGTVFLKSHVELHLETGAVLKGSTDLGDYNNDCLDPVRDTDYPQNMVCVPEEWRGKHMIVAHDCEDVAITGGGCVDGSADAFFEEPWFTDDGRNIYYYPDGWSWTVDKKNLRPGQVIVFAECRDVRVEDITVRNAPCWDILLHGCDYVQVRGITVRNPRWFINTDGIDIDCCTYVTVSDCVIDTGDDCITVRADPTPLRDKTRKSQYITVSNCTLSSTCFAFRIGVGRGDIEHVRVSDITVSRAASPIALTSNWNREFTTGIRDVNFSDISAAEVSFPLILSAGVHKETADITIENYRCNAFGQAQIHAEKPGMLHDVTIRNAEFRYLHKEGLELTDNVKNYHRGNDMVSLRGADNVTLDGLRVRCTDAVYAEWNRVLSVENCRGLRIERTELP